MERKGDSMRHRTTGAAIVIAVLLIPVGIASATYHPTAGRWAQRDPSGYVDGMSLYEYVRSRCTSLTDPDGSDGRTPAQKKLDSEIGREARYSYVRSLDYYRTATDPSGVPPESARDPTWYEDLLSRAHLSFMESVVAYHDKRHSCGPDITAELSAMLKDLESFYKDEQESNKERKSLCRRVFEPRPGAFGAWDIVPLREMSKRKKGAGYPFGDPMEGKMSNVSWARSVQVKGRCYDAGAVNFVMFGRMARLCQGCWIADWNDVYNRILAWKVAGHWEFPRTEALDWAYAGWRNWPEGNIPRSTTPYPCRNREWGEVYPKKKGRWSPHAFIWLKRGE